MEKQLTLRVKPGSEMDRMAKALLASDTMTDAEMKELAGSSWGADVFRRFCSSFDNLRIIRDRKTTDNRLVYVDPTPAVPVSVGIEVKQSSSPSVQPVQDIDISTEVPNIRWPQAPPLIESMGDKFREPAWFNIMRSMVGNGRHIALAGPPGVGKDTAVSELAAQEGKVLVTIGGDAGFRKRDLVGTSQISNGHSFIEVAEYAAAVVNGWWVLLTEVNAADADALMTINTQLAAPYIITIGGVAYPVHPDFRLFITYNPGLVGTKPLPQSFKDRFFSIQTGWFTKAQLKGLLVSHGMPTDAVWAEDIVQFGMLLWDAHVRGTIRYQVTSRRLMDAVELMKSGLVDSTMEALSMAVVAAIDSPVEAKVAQQIINGMH